MDIDVTSFLLGKSQGGGGSPTLQTKNVTITSNTETTVTPDEGYDGLEEVTITTNVQAPKYAPKIILFTGFTGTDLSYETQNLNTSNITTMKEMFKNCNTLTTIDLSGWNTSNVTNMNAMFQNDWSLTSLNLSNFDTSKVTDMSYMISTRGTSTDVLESITFGTGWDTSKVENFSNMFRCSKVSAIDFSKFDFTSCTNAQTMLGSSYNKTLTDDSYNALLGALITGVNIPTKTLKYIGLSSAQCNKCVTLSNWSALESAGWTTGY